MFSMNLWSYFSTTEITSDKPKMDQNKVLKLSSTLQGNSSHVRDTQQLTFLHERCRYPNFSGHPAGLGLAGGACILKQRHIRLLRRLGKTIPSKGQALSSPLSPFIGTAGCGIIFIL